MANGNGLPPIFDDPPQKHVFLLTCMDQRLLDDTVQFMNKMNLQNRYDQVVFAGSAMGARLIKSPAGPKAKPLPWKSVFFAHLDAAINVLHRDIQDIFLLEHLDCGAYKYLHPKKKIQKRYRDAAPAKQADFHRREAKLFAADVEQFCREQQDPSNENADAWKKIRVTSFVMDLIGRVRQF